MRLLKLFGLKLESSKQYAKEIELEKNYSFMYDNFVFSSQQNLYLFLEENNGTIEALKFEFKIYKYGYPNDEVEFSFKIPDVKLYGISEVYNSEWIEELKVNNRDHIRHSDDYYSNYKHYIIRFKDVTLEVVSENYNIIKMSKDELDEILNKELSYIKNNS
ncbi:MAG: hypothetical protein RLZZ540_2625 [Bacteroidota bacterium]|jgi:hypothetical protein